MKIIPAIDLKNNKCVRLSKGKDYSSVVYNEDPEKQAIYFEQIGCEKLHLIDLDAAFGRSNVNFETIKKIRKSISIPIQLGGGVRNLDLAKKYFEAGINNLIIGSMSVEKPNEVIILSNQYADKVYISLDILEDNIMIKGWDENSGKKIQELLDIYNDSKIKGYIITDIQNDGMLKGLNLDFINNFLKKINLIKKFKKNIIIAGGLTDYSDLMNLKKLKSKNIEGVISGKSFYEGRIDLVKAQKILN
ncbi:1-(5-phosphoribosyl)-5-[(5-phosphoribosylamino)methylideneamino] imidazole-4-carboxamide isomerase [Pelagibacteraceae bacterium]|nr:1-(5-phosphoribosyl)-5-[(5-phosphoribosylamino)methylideneamino] imidazole-4-carboxamide isomerase [Pelagibacteraceae bacterium]